MDGRIIRRTQDTLGKVIRRPRLTEKLLGRPPFVFLHDIFTEVIRTTGFMKGLYSETEMISDNVKEREAKVAFLQKAIDMLTIVTGETLSARPSRIVAGMEVEKTNELLQGIASCCLNKVSSDDAVCRVLSGEKSAVQGRVPPGSKVQERKAHSAGLKLNGKNELEEQDEQGGEMVHNGPLHDDQDKGKDNGRNKYMERKDREREKDRDRDKERDRDREKDSERVKTKDRERDKDKDKGRDRERSRYKEKDRDKDRERYKERDKERERHKKKEKEMIKEREKDRVRDKHREQGKHQNMDPHRNHQRERSHTRKQEPRKEDRYLDKAKRDKKESEVVGKRTEERTNAVQERQQETEESALQDRIPRPPTAKGHRRRQSIHEADAEKGQEDKGESYINGDVQANKSSRAMIRPGSARTAPPHAHHSNSAEASGLERTGGGKVVTNVIEEGGNVDEDEDGFLVTELPPQLDAVPPDKQHTDSTSTLVEGEEHGGLVKKILQTKRDYEAEHMPLKAGDKVVFDARRQRQREQVEREIEQLRAAVQELCRGTQPLGKVMDFLQEDTDSMQLEMQAWCQEWRKLSEALDHERSLMEQAVEPLQTQLTGLDQQILEQQDKICVVKARVLRNEEKIQKMLASTHLYTHM